MPKLGKVMVVDDEPELLQALCEILREQGYETMGFAVGREALAALGERDFDLLLTDLMMPEMDGLALLKASLEIDPHLVGIIMTGQGTVQTALGAMKIGAFDYVLKPFKMQELLPIFSRAMEVRKLRLENVELRQTAAVYDLTMMVALTLDLNLILDKTAETALLQCQADEVSILLPAEEGGEFYVAMVSGAEREHLLGERMPMDQGIAGWVARHQEPLVLCGAVVDPRFAPVNPRAEIQVAASLPMVVGGKLVGVLNVNALHRRRPFTSGEMKALRLLTSIASAALESAALYEQARQAEGKYRSIFEQAMEGIFQSTPEGLFLSANPALARMLGYDTSEEMTAVVADIGQQLYVDPGQRAEFKSRIETEGKVEDFETQMWHRDDRKIWVSISARCVRDAEGRALYYEGLIEDISVRKRQEREEKALQQVREELWKMRSADEIGRVLVAVRQAIEDMEVPFRACDLNLVNVSSATPKVYWQDLMLQGKWEGVEVKSVGGVQAILAFWQAGRVAYRRDLEAEDVHQERGPIQSRFGHPVFSVIDVPFSHGTLALNSDRPNAYSEEDITFLEKLVGVLSEGFHRLDDLKTIELTQAQLQQAQKMEILGQLAGGVAHDFNNLLTIISGYTETLLRKREVDAGQRELLTEIQQAGERGQGLVRQLLVFSRKQAVQVEEVDLNQVVRGMEKMMGRLIGKGIELSLDLVPELGRIKADVGQVEQVLMNLVVNARDAMPEGGSLLVETVNTGGEDGQPQVMLAVQDTGIGMEEEVQQHILEPFFTTKEAGKGTGLGLAVVQRVVGQAGGHILVHSRPGQGARFEIYWPCLEGRRRTILVVDDEAKVVQLVELMLRGQGYEVLAATGGEEALGLCGQHSGRIDLLLADVEMPGRKGWEVAAQVKEVYPGIPVVYISGYRHHPEVERQVREGEAGFLAKPFSAEMLLHKVREVLNATADTR